MTKFPEIFAPLAAPFERDEVKIRTHAGMAMQYITARTAMNRLDNVLGPENWWDVYVESHNSCAVSCGLTIRLPDGTTITKWDVGGKTDMKDADDSEKSGHSDAFKRACVKIGVGRYLYKDGVPDFCRPAKSVTTPAIAEAPVPAAPVESSSHKAKQTWKGGYPPKEGTEPMPVKASPVPAAAEAQGPEILPGPKIGKHLYQWIRSIEKKTGYPLLPYINGWGKQQGYPSRIVDWDTAQTKLGLEELNRKLGSDEPSDHAMAS